MPVRGLNWADYRSNREWMSERGSLGVNLPGGRDEIGHGGAYPRAAGEVSRGGGGRGASADGQQG